jgi:two-component system phosphate regulon sensor histidine kinase PhoR
MRRLFALLVVIVLAAALGGELSGSPTMAWLAALAAGLAWTAWDAWNSQRFSHWLRAMPDAAIDPGPSRNPQLPTLRGYWGELQFRIAQRLRRARDQTEGERRRLDHFLRAIQASPNGVALLDEHDAIEWCNRQLALQLGLDAERDRGQRIAYLVRQPLFVDYLNSRQYTEPIVLRGVGSQAQAVHLQLFPFGEGSKLLLTRDVTEAERMDTMRRDFVANVSHELKTPLTVLKGFLETVRDLPLEEADRQRYMTMMVLQAERMQRLVDDLLTLAKLESETRVAQGDWLDMEQIVQSLTAQAQALSNGQHHIEAHCDAASMLLGVQSELMSAFSNLVSNAVRYTGGGGTVSIRWHIHPTTHQGLLEVRDTGVGIAPEHVPRLTERFYRVDRARSRDSGGTGLGLAIAKHALQHHGAELRIDSVEGKGSCFTAVFGGDRIKPRSITGDSASAAAEASPPIVAGTDAPRAGGR